MVVYYLVLKLEGTGIRFAQNTTQTLIGGQLKITPAFINVSAGQRFYLNKTTASSVLDVSLKISSPRSLTLYYCLMYFRLRRLL